MNISQSILGLGLPLCITTGLLLEIFNLNALVNVSKSLDVLQRNSSMVFFYSD